VLKIRYTAEAHRDLVDALDHGVHADPTATAHLADRLLLVIERLAAGAFEGPETVLTTGETVRSWPVRPFRIYYDEPATSCWSSASITKPARRSDP
jgi:plasmid stabilization system protein ParE